MRAAGNDATVVAAALSMDPLFGHGTNQCTHDFEQHECHAQQDEPQHQVSMLQHSASVFLGIGAAVKIFRKYSVSEVRWGERPREPER